MRKDGSGGGGSCPYPTGGKLAGGVFNSSATAGHREQIQHLLWVLAQLVNSMGPGQSQLILAGARGCISSPKVLALSLPFS